MLFNFLFAGNILLSVLVTVFFLLILRKDNLPFWEKLPRERISGGILGFLALLAFIPNVEPMFPVEKYLGILVFLAIVLAVLCYLYADHLFARAFAGILILCAHASLAESYAANVSFTSFFAVVALLYGSCGIVTAAKPYYLRELFRKCAGNVYWKSAVVLLGMVWLIASVLVLIRIPVK